MGKRKEKWKGEKVKIKVNMLCQRENHLDSNGNVFTPRALKENNGKEIPLLLNFDLKKMIGKAKLIYKEGEGLFVLEIETDKIKEIKELKPALYGAAKVENSMNGQQTITNMFKIFSVGCVSSHADSSIKTFGEKDET